jgi:hypothetical protein
MTALILPYLAVILYTWTIFFLLKNQHWGVLADIKLSKVPLILKKIGLIYLSPEIFFLCQAVPMFTIILRNTASVIYIMITRHRTEFKKHRTQLLGQAFGWLFSIGLLIVETYIFCIFVSCLVTEGTTLD